MPATGTTYVTLTTPQLQELADEARTRGYNRTLSPGFMARVDRDPNARHIVAHNFMHDDDQVRGLIIVKEFGTLIPMVGTLDFALETFMRLPRTGYDSHGNVVEVLTEGKGKRTRRKTRILMSRAERDEIRRKLAAAS